MYYKRWPCPLCTGLWTPNQFWVTGVFLSVPRYDWCTPLSHPFQVCLWIMDPHSRAPKKNTSHENELVGDLSPVSHKGLHQGWTQTSLYHQVIHFTSHHNTFFLAYLYSAGTQHGNLHLAGWPILFCGPTQEPCVSHSQHRRNRDRFWKKKSRWMDRKGRNKKGRNPWQ